VPTASISCPSSTPKLRRRSSPAWLRKSADATRQDAYRRKSLVWRTHRRPTGIGWKPGVRPKARA
jgi:hypothetical protein